MTSRYEIRLLKSTVKDLEKLDKIIAKRIIARINWLSENFGLIKLIPLKGELNGLFKLREGDYRIIFEVIHAEKIIIIHAVGYRRDIYKKL